MLASLRTLQYKLLRKMTKVLHSKIWQVWKCQMLKCRRIRTYIFPKNRSDVLIPIVLFFTGCDQYTYQKAYRWAITTIWLRIEKKKTKSMYCLYSSLVDTNFFFLKARITIPDFFFFNLSFRFVTNLIGFDLNMSANFACPI